MSNLKHTGGASRQKINLSKIIDNAKKELLEIEALKIPQSPKTKKFTRLATKIKNELRGDKRKFIDKKTGKYDPKKQISLSTYHGYLTRVRTALKELNIKHHSLPSKIKTLTRKYPEYKKELKAILDEPALTVGNAKAQALKSIKESQGINRMDAYKAVNKLKIDHDVITRLVKTDLEKAEHDDFQKQSLKRKKQNTVTLNYFDIKTMITELLISNAYSNRTLALSLASGRRAIEIIYTADFKVTGKNTVLFSGQTKKRQGVQTDDYEIYTLIPAKDFVKEFRKYRNMKMVKAIHADANKFTTDREKHIYINLRVAKTLSEATKRAFRAFCTDDSHKKRVFKDSRGIYTRIVLDKFFSTDKRWESKDEDEFLKVLLGHSDYKDQRNYKQFKIDYSEKTDAQPESKENSKKPLKNPLNAIDEDIKATGKKAMVALHERVKIWARNNPDWKLSQTVMTKPKGVGKIGGGRALIKEYLLIAQPAFNKYNEAK